MPPSIPPSSSSSVPQSPGSSPAHQLERIAEEGVDDDDDDDPDDDDDDEVEEETENYFSVLKELSKQWRLTQLTHHVSAEAANSFWNISMGEIPKLLYFKDKDAVRKKTPQFVHQRRKLDKEFSPEVNMTFGYKNKEDGSIVTVDCTSTPINQYQRNPKYVKLYEEAHIEVSNAQV